MSKLTNEIKSLFKFEIGQTVYLKQDVMNDISRMNINGKEIDKILLQKAIIIYTMTIEIEDGESYEKRYIVRPDAFRMIGNGISPNTFMTLKEFEICSKEEAIVILKLKDSA